MAKFEMDRRQFLRDAGLLAAISASGVSLAMAFDARRDPRTQLRFYANKRETKAYYTAEANRFNLSQGDYIVNLEQSTNLAADFARDTPVAVGMVGLDISTGAYLRLGVLADQTNNSVVDNLDPHAIELIKQYGTFEGQLGALPFSITGQGVIYNRDLFDQAGAQVPTTWSEFIETCELLKSKGITPILGTFSDIWTLEFGLFNFGAVGMMDVGGFFERLNALGTDVGPDADVSFTKDMREPMLKVTQLLPYFNSNVKNIGYDQGNRDLAAGKAAMMFQGPWAFNGILAANRDFQGGMFPLPMTEDPADTIVTANLDQMLFTPASATGAKQSGGLEFMNYLMQPEVMEAYNADQRGFSPLKKAATQTDPLIEGLSGYMSDSKYAMGPTLYIPGAIDKGRYLQEYVYAMMADPGNEGAVDRFLGRLDSEWKRLAVRLAA